MVNVQAWQSHGETILDISDQQTGEQLEKCPECGGEFTEETLFPLDFFPEVFAEMAEAEVANA
jgi:hypothetical protein